MQAITLEVILRAVFGVEDAGRREDLRASLVEVLAATASPAAVGFTAPGIRRLPPFRRIAALRARADELLYAEIAEHRRRPDLAERDDILSMLLTARFDDGSRMDDRELRDQLMTLLLAGHETTATGLAWAFDLLLHTPGTLERLREELAAGERRLPRRGRRRDAAGTPGGPVHRPPAAPGLRARRLRAPLRDGDPGRDLPRPHPGRQLSGPVRVPARALPRRLAAGDLLVDPVRRRHPPLHRRGLRRARDAGRDRDDPLARSTCARPRRGRRSRSAATSPSRRPTAPG